MGDFFNQVFEGIANVFGAGPSGGPLGSIKHITGPLIGGALTLFPPTAPIGIADLAAQAGGAFARGDPLSGGLDLLGAGLAGANAAGLFGAGAAPGAAGAAGAAGASAAAPAVSLGTSLADFAAAPTLSGIGDIASAAGSDIASGVSAIGSDISSGVGAIGSDVSSGFNSLLASLGLGGSTATLPSDAALLAAPSTGATAATAAGPALLTAADVPGAGLDFGASAAPTFDQTGLLATPAQAAQFAQTGALPAANTGLLSTITNFAKAHPLLTLGGTTLASQLLSPAISKITGGGMTSQEKALLANEQPAINAANQLIGSEASGTLPPGAYASVNSALQADIANIRSRYAATGQSGSSAEAQDIANAQQQASAKQFALAQQATQTGLNALGLNQKAYDTLIQDQLNQQEQLSKAFSGLFSAFGEGTALGAAKAA